MHRGESADPEQAAATALGVSTISRKRLDTPR